MAELYALRKPPNRETAEELLHRLEQHHNYIPASARGEYKSVLLKEYRDFIASRRDKIK